MSDDYSFVVAFVVYLFNMDIYLYISMYIQAEYRRFGVFNFFCVNYCTCYIFFYCDGCFLSAAGGRGFFVFFPPDGVNIIYNKGFLSFLLLSSSHSLHRLSPPSRSRFYKGGFIP